MSNDFGKWLARARSGIEGMTVRRLASLSGVSTGMISDVENGHRRAGPETAVAFLDALNVKGKNRTAAMKMAARDAGWKL